MHAQTDQSQTNERHANERGLPSNAAQHAAYCLYDMGLNVFPQPLGRKGGLPWKRLQYSRLHRDDGDVGLHPLFAGETNLAVMCGATSDNLFVIDCETPGALAHHMRQLRQRGIALWVVQTARGGHIYLRAADGEVHNVEPGVLLDAEIKGQRGYVLAPPSVHPSGVVYKWLLREGDEIPIVESASIDWLRGAADERVTLEVDPPTNPQYGNWQTNYISPMWNLSWQTRNYIRNGATLPEGNRNNRLFSAACDLHGNGYTHAETVNLLGVVAQRSGLPRSEVIQTIASAYSRPRVAARREKFRVPAGDWRYALLYGTHRQWEGRTAGTDRALFVALIERCRLAANENEVFRASLRELSELSSLGINTIRRGLQRFREDGLLLLRGQDITSGASLWRFPDTIVDKGKSLELKLDTLGIAPHWISFSVSVFNSDVAERGALGHSVTFIYEFLRTVEAPMMPAEIADSLGVSVNAVNYALRKLDGLDLVQRLTTGWRILGLTLNELEAHLDECTDAIGKGAARKQRYKEERQRFAGKILHMARLRREGDVYRAAILAQHREMWRQKYLDDEWDSIQAILDDELLQEGLALGGAIRLRCGLYLSEDGIH